MTHNPDHALIAFLESVHEQATDELLDATRTWRDEEERILAEREVQWLEEVDQGERELHEERMRQETQC